MEQSIVEYESDANLCLQVKTDGDTVWLSQEQMSQLLGRDQSVIARHISNIFKEGELEKEVVYEKFAYTTQHGAISCIARRFQGMDVTRKSPQMRGICRTDGDCGII